MNADQSAAAGAGGQGTGGLPVARAALPVTANALNSSCGAAKGEEWVHAGVSWIF